MGGVSEWLKETDCKSVGYAYVGSNPTSSTIFGPIGALPLPLKGKGICAARTAKMAGVAQW